MRAITFAEYGGPEVLQLSEVPVPEPGAGEVRVAVRRAGVNPLDWKVRKGVMSDGTPLKGPQIPGYEVAGVVDAVGDGAEFSIGDEVFGWSSEGAYAEFALASAVTRKPADLSWDDAAALPVAGETALRVLRLLDVKAGEVLLIHGASGAVGRFATQAAVELGATVIGTAGQHNLDEVESLGAIPVRYGDGWPERVREAAAGQAVDAVFDTSGHGVLPASVELRGSTERVVTVADPAAFQLGLPFSAGEDADRREVLNEILGYVKRGLRIAQGTSYPLEEAAAAQVESEKGHPGGKLTIAVS
ncbi:NADP-dependent oxidoreductase [Amycolatopsis jiangsuensis]|uniref:NADPH:quinone reductase-like Zn-dependent oxidoreductase n=1 Tax=Amycolatopsis jiangsuensis TaxID=1181879 RepID=A0A840ISF4_9PSEU|nr:NADP-dependent oxidoreductase [Amycolatopsis jiangsuensis]MBB4685541.1 NADPH:quinone reductase-like Zn-dependent oxidoreductase [Amycolatopsis jiangsuensis]